MTTKMRKDFLSTMDYTKKNQFLFKFILLYFFIHLFRVVRQSYLPMHDDNRLGIVFVH